MRGSYPRRLPLFALLPFAVVLALIATPLATLRVAAQDNPFAGVELPPDIGQTDFQVYVPDTRHTLRGSMLDYWRANGAAAVYGNPISEPFAAANGLYSQAFEGGVFQYHPEFLYTDEPVMRLMPIGTTALNQRLDSFRRDGRRGLGGGDRRHAAWSPLPVDSRAVQRAAAEGGIYADATGHTVTREFLSWYEQHEGSFYLGDPISQPVRERGLTVQYFEGALLMRDAEGAVTVAPLAREIAGALEIDTSAVERGDLPTYSERLFLSRANPNPLGDPETPGRKWIEISISEQTLWAYQGDSLITSTFVSTGLAPNETETGLFHVRLKYPKQDMRGFENGTGEVVGFGDEAPADGTRSYDVKDVPNVMYFNMDAEALHGAYWHNNFGTRMSHGCVNLPLEFAAFLYEWAPLGTMVWVHD
ncbi:MAG: hypothetical protein QOG89_3282 [Thermomicrobiales bacterium]|nr:hypothetical protein [Thermomicrobiales bacterium]